MAQSGNGVSTNLLSNLPILCVNSHFTDPAAKFCCFMCSLLELITLSEKSSTERSICNALESAKQRSVYGVEVFLLRFKYFNLFCDGLIKLIFVCVHVLQEEARNKSKCMVSGLNVILLMNLCCWPTRS